MQVIKHLYIYQRLTALCLGVMLMFTLSRLMLVSVHWGRVSPTDGLWFILLQGFRFDLILIGMIFGAGFLLKHWFHSVTPARRIGNWILSVYLGLTTALIFFVEAATLSFIAEYDSRPNYLFVEYLNHPREVLATLTGTHLLELIVFTPVALLLAWYVARWQRNDPYAKAKVPLLFCLLVTPIIAALLLLMIRSTLDHRPVNPSIAAFSQDAMVNQLPLNSFYSLLYAVYEQKKRGADKGVQYGSMDDDEVLSIILQEAGIQADEITHPDFPTLHRQTATRTWQTPLNLVIVLEESLGAEFVGSLGGEDLTPNLDAMASDGIWFDQLYATGTRSVRGIEAVISGFTPTSRRSVVKLPETQDNFFTLAGLLQDLGYQTSFIYGGEAHFDNMKRFFLNNGFQNVVDENDYVNPVFSGSWGVSDEDLFTRAHDEFSAIADQPFFSLVFTSSNHDPFDIPPGRVEELPGPEGPRQTAIRYADHALGQFIETARQSEYWDNTVFLVLADHNSRVYGSQLVPVERFHIPGVILGGSIEPRRVPGVSSQIDLLPTLLSLIGISSEHPAIGRDLTLPRYLTGAGRAMMQFNSLQAYIESDVVIVLQPDLEPRAFSLEPGGQMTLMDETNKLLERKALAYALWGPLMINRKAYQH
jgi:phosphoglycerol transferase MdoB-like AlkP superfamily enzyme